MRIQLGLFLALAVAGCGNPIPVTNDLAETQDLATPSNGADLSNVPGTCSPTCGGLTPKCNGKNHCVACLVDTDCPAGSECKVLSDIASSCVLGCQNDSNCGTGKKCCGGACADTTMDINNCGACATVCSGVHASASCTAGKCALGTCDSGYGDCNMNAADGCEANLHTDVNNCTACGMMCSFANAIAACADTCYMAACQFGFADCDNNPMNGCETSVATDPMNCGGCGILCKALPNAMPVCMSSACDIGSCNPGFFDCDQMPGNGCEVNIFTDSNNCGACGAKCGNGLVCKNGGCTCPNCNFPNATSTCVNNMCVMGACNQGYADCNMSPMDGCEVNLNADGKNCSACGSVCPVNTPGCSNGKCVPCGNDCWGPNGCLTGAGKCIQFTCRPGNAGQAFCNGCKGWKDVTYDQWINGGYCADVIKTYRANNMAQTKCGGNLGCCNGSVACGGGDNAWHFYNVAMNANYYTGPVLGSANDVNCLNWNNVDNSAYTRLTICEQ